MGTADSGECWLGELWTKFQMLSASLTQNLSRVHVLQRHYIFKPATLQSLWTAIQVDTFSLQCSTAHHHLLPNYLLATFILKKMNMRIITSVTIVHQRFFLRRCTRSAQNWNQRETRSWFANSNISDKTLLDLKYKI